VTHPIKSPRKLIEVALPLDAINAASARENYIYKGNPSAVHKWWAQRPLAAARAVIFAQLVNDPGFQQGGGFRYGKGKREATVERARLFKILEDLVVWENSTNAKVLDAAREEIRRSWRETCELNRSHPDAARLFDPADLPALHDPFAGGGTIPLEAQRLGVPAQASDLNPVALLINKALLEIPSRFLNGAPVGPLPRGAQSTSATWNGFSGLSEDIRRYGAWIREQALLRIGFLYPDATVSAALAEARPDLRAHVGKKLPVIAWLWARTVKSPNPAYSHVDVPLATTFVVSSKPGRQVYVHPTVVGDSYHFAVKIGEPPPEATEGTKATGRGAEFRCLVSNAPIDADYIRREAQAGRMGTRLLAIVAEAGGGRVYLPPTPDAEAAAAAAVPTWTPDVEFFPQALGFRVGNYGMSRWSDLFTPRQATALSALSDLVIETRSKVLADALSAGMNPDTRGIDEGGSGSVAYAEAISVYLAFAVSKTCEYSSSLTVWYSREDRPKGLFARQAIPMVWDFPEQNPLGDIGGTFIKSSAIVADSLTGLLPDASAHVFQANATAIASGDDKAALTFISTDPPYYDNIGYADLSDFFYVWLRRSLRDVFPGLFTTIAVPKAEELVATPGRHGGKERAEAFFLDGMTSAMKKLAEMAHPSAPITVYYAFKQSETRSRGGTSSTGWETFLEAAHRAGLALTATWPMRTEREGRSRGIESNALASSVVLAYRKRDPGAGSTSRREFLRELNNVLPDALDEMTRGAGDNRSPVAPVDLSQAIIGPGMAVFSRYSAVLEADGSPMSVRTALQLINRFLAEDDFDHDTQFCLHWFDQHGWGEGVYGEADVLARAKATSVAGLADAGVVKSGAGKVRLLRPNEYPAEWDARKDPRVPIWEALHQLIRAVRDEGETAAGLLLAAVKPKSEAIRQLAYRLYTLCERRGWADDARAYNELVTSWSGIEAAAGEVPESDDQLNLFGGKE
jgi:putative DNA methylase